PQMENKLAKECYLAIVRVLRTGSHSIGSFHRRKEQRGQRQHPNSAGTAAAPDTCKRSVDVEVARLRHLAGDESEGPVADVEHSRWGSVLVGKLPDHHAAAVGQIKYGAVDKPNADFAARRRFDDVALAEQIANLYLNRLVA